MLCSKCAMFLILTIIAGSVLDAQIPDTLWTRTFGGTDYDYGEAVIQTLDGGYIIAGFTYSFSNNPGYDDVYLIKTDANGDTIWTRTYGDSAYDGAFDIQLTSDGGYIVTGMADSHGGFDGLVYLIKINAQGDTIWTRKYGGTSGYDGGNSVKQTSDGGYIIAGETISYGAGLMDIYLIRTNEHGDTIWTRTYGGYNWDSGRSVIQTVEGDFVITGVTLSFGAGDPDVYVIKTNFLGDTIWTRRFGGSGQDQGESIQQTSDGGFIITGYTNSYGNDFQVFLLKLDAFGNLLWSRTFGGPYVDTGLSGNVITSGGFIIVGDTDTSGLNNNDVYIIKTNAQGETLWSNTYGGNNRDWATSTQATMDDGYIVVGSTHSFGAGGTDIWLLKIAPDSFAIAEKKLQEIPNFNVTISSNPFRSILEIRIPQLSEAEIFIYDVFGRNIQMIPVRDSKAVWNGKTDKNQQAPCGVYFLLIKTHEQTIGKKVIKLN